MKLHFNLIKNPHNERMAFESDGEYELQLAARRFLFEFVNYVLRQWHV